MSSAGGTMQNHTYIYLNIKGAVGLFNFPNKKVLKEKYDLYGVHSDYFCSVNTRIFYSLGT